MKMPKNITAQIAAIPALLISIHAGAATNALSKTTTFVQAQKIWEEAKEISSTEINGQWKRLAVYEHADCKDIMHGNAFEPSGIKNEDGSFFMLSFEGHQVKFINVASKEGTQGPYEINSHKTAFTSWAYDENTVNKDLTDQAYGTFDCRQMATDNNQIICSIGTRIINEAAADPVFKTCSKLESGLVVLFSKVE